MAVKVLKEERKAALACIAALLGKDRVTAQELAIVERLRAKL